MLQTKRKIKRKKHNYDISEVLTKMNKINAGKYKFFAAKRDNETSGHTGRYVIRLNRSNEFIGFYVKVPPLPKVHILYGHFNDLRKEPTGLHHLTGVREKPQIFYLIESKRKNGNKNIYKLEYKKFHNKYGWRPFPNNKNKGKPSTFFPDNWTWPKIKQEVESAYRNDNTVFSFRGNGDRWGGYSKSGIFISGYINKTNQMPSAYPVIL